MSSDQNPETLVMCAKLAEQAERYDDMAEVWLCKFVHTLILCKRAALLILLSPCSI